MTTQKSQKIAKLKRLIYTLRQYICNLCLVIIFYLTENWKNNVWQRKVVKNRKNCIRKFKIFGESIFDFWKMDKKNVQKWKSKKTFPKNFKLFSVTIKKSYGVDVKIFFLFLWRYFFYKILEKFYRNVQDNFLTTQKSQKNAKLKRSIFALR